MKRMMIWMLVLLMGRTVAEAKENGVWDSVMERASLQKELQGEEMWRRKLGQERCLLLYIDETGMRRMSFIDGPWIYLAEELVVRIKEAGMQCWEKESGLLK